jgi:pectate lyase
MIHNSRLSAIGLAVAAFAQFSYSPMALAQRPCPPVLCVGDCAPSVQAGACAGPGPSELEGFGAVTTGGAGGEVCRVTTLADSGTGSFRSCVLSRNTQSGGFIPRTVVFDVGGEIRLQSDIHINSSFLTIDGSTAPSPGITIRKVTFEDGEIRLNTTPTQTAHDIIVTHLRFDGEWPGNDGTISNTSSTINMDGEDNAPGVYRIVMDHLTLTRGTDSSPDMWGEVNDITVSWSLFYNNLHPMTISHSGGSQARHRISIHHNVFAKNHERSPQIRGNVVDFDYVNNILYQWGLFSGGGYGVRIREVGGTYPTDMNFINNYFLSTNRSSWGLVYEDSPGGATYPGAIWVSGNVLPSANSDGYATRASVVPIPATAQVTTYPTSELAAQVLPNVGMKYRTSEEVALLAQIAADMNAQ